MGQGCATRLILFGTNLDASGGDVSQKICLGHDLFTGNSVAGTATQYYIPEDGYLTAFAGTSEDGGLLNIRIGIVGESDKIGGSMFHAGQTEGGPLNRLTGRIMQPVKKGDAIEVTMTNGAAKFDTVGILYGMGIAPQLSSEPFGQLPVGAAWREFTTAHTSTADTLVKGAMTWPDYTLHNEKLYRILAVAFQGATAHWFQVRPKDGPDIGNAPGWIAGDTDQIVHPVYFSHPPTFSGRHGCELATLCHAGDTAGVGQALVLEV